MAHRNLDSKVHLLFEDKEETVKEILRVIEDRYGEVPLVSRVMSTRPEVFIPGFIKSSNLIAGSALEPKVAELVALASAVALRCDACALSHMKRALDSGANKEEVLGAVFIASHVAETSSLAVGLRKFLEVDSAADEDCGCDSVCSFEGSAKESE